MSTRHSAISGHSLTHRTKITDKIIGQPPISAGEVEFGDPHEHHAFDIDDLFNSRAPHMNGLDLCDQLRIIPGFEEIPIVFMTAAASMPWDQVKRRKLTALSKPFKLITVLQTIEKLLNGSSVGPNS